MKAVYRLFIKGLVVVLPVTVTIYVLVLVAMKAEGVFGGFLRSLVGPEFYVPGLGIAVTFLAILGVGVLVSNFITARIITWAIEKFESFPLVKAIYRPLNDLIGLFASNDENKMKKVVMVNFEQLGARCLGLVTREEFGDLPEGTLPPNQIAVYIPMGYMIGGFVLMVDRDDVEEVDMSVETALKLSITGWVTSDRKS